MLQHAIQHLRGRRGIHSPRASQNRGNPLGPLGYAAAVDDTKPACMTTVSQTVLFARVMQKIWYTQDDRPGM